MPYVKYCIYQLIFNGSNVSRPGHYIDAFFKSNYISVFCHLNNNPSNHTDI